MSIKKQKDGRFLCRIDRKDCKRVAKTFQTWEQADRFEHDFLSNPANKLNFSSPEQPETRQDKRRLTELIRLWYEYHGMSLTDGTMRRSKLEAMAREMGNPIAERLTGEQIVAWRYEKLQKGWSKKTANNLLCYLKALFSKLKKIGVIDYPNPASGVEAIKLQEVEMSFLSDGQISVLFDALKQSDNPDTYFVAQICLRIGARWREAERLKVRNLRDGVIVLANTKSKKIRYLPIEKDFYTELVALTKGKEPDDRIFQNCMMAFRGAVKRARISLPAGQCSHVLRHTFASTYMQRGGKITELKEILGHASIVQTMRYAHFAQNHLNDVVNLNPTAKFAVKPLNPDR